MLETKYITIAPEDYAKRQEFAGLSGDRNVPVVVKSLFETVMISGRQQIKYRNLEAVRYARKWCSQKMNSCGVYFQKGKWSDCAHFLSHCLHKGGITIKRESEPNECQDNLSVRVTEIVKVLTELSEMYQNIIPISYDEGVWGDPAYLEALHLRPSHAVLIHSTRNVVGQPDKRETLYYAHSYERCGTKGDLEWYQNFGGAFRIYDAK